MKKEEYLLNEVGLDIAKENIVKEIRKTMKNMEKENLKEELNKLIQDVEKIQRGEIETIKKYMEEINIE